MGWGRTHANSPWHREALLGALAADPDRVETAIKALPAAEVEIRVHEAGGRAVAVRTGRTWSVAQLQLVRDLGAVPAPALIGSPGAVAARAGADPGAAT